MTRTLTAAALVLATAPAAFAQEMSQTTGLERGGQIGSEETFTGTVFVAPVFGPNMNDVSAGEVTFMPGARSAWHTHPIGQYLVVTAGTGWYQEEGQPKQIMRTGDVVFAPEGVNHWHGATDTTSVTHYAIQANEDGSAVTWGELVSDEEYNGE
ncbi:MULTISPECIES: (R)-mandelonitrile lyase [Salipiger]|uniref:Cupin family protein n=1 Tax=Salipiger bermudensis (strain DSM 26914 / JCM 13377 / KCTC 12554 / HTCC2601) TaxID=314265 RepID=Q0FTW8_SALBH|nr:cupin domain-containing protein [Salipiger bermudensis]EAU47631.1 cupin family protein [Salipiger bermudensis HTCC2601]MBR9894464.1 cupin domain-containing protein [bacterium]MCA1287091.1 cupin domain-containing protein [Salipiger bermudensis]